MDGTGGNTYYDRAGSGGSGHISDAVSDGYMENNGSTGNGKATITLIQASSHTLTIDANGGIYSGNTPVQVEPGATTTVPYPTRTGYGFTNWTVLGSGSSISGTTFTMGNEDTTLTANWQRINYNLNVNPNGGSWNGSTSAQNFTIAYQGTKEISDPTRTGYDFAGWSLSGTGSSLSGKTFTMGYEDATLTANWKIKSYTLTVDPNGGNCNGNINNQTSTIQYGGTKTIENPTRNGFTFTGWTVSGTGSSMNGTTFTMGYQNTTLTANWQRNNYTLTVNPDGGTWEGSTSTQSFTIAYEGTKTISNPTRYGYTFNGWNLTGTESTLTGTTFRMGYQNSTLTATWSLITHNITGTVTWSDQTNKYLARPDNVTVTLSRNPTTGGVTPVPDPLQITGNATFNFSNVQTYDTTTGNAYTYTVSQNKVPGYKTTINKYDITNELILPTYTSSISYTPIDTYKNLYLKNGKIKINANIESTSGNTYSELGLNNGIATFTIDSDILLDTSTLKIYHTDSDGTKKQITNYTLNNNVLTIDFGDNKISKAKDKIEIEVYGTLNEIKEYSSTISLAGNLRAYDGENTNINLGTLTSTNKKITAEYQMPQANISIIKHDSITEQNLTDATFTLYEWNGTEYVEKETIKDRK